MKKVLLSTLAMALSFFVYAQPVADNATIPVSVTVNSILRLNVTSGGNIEFVFNSLENMTNGIAASTRTTTTFTVASSRTFDVAIEPEGDLVGNEGGTLATSYIGLLVTAANGTIQGTFGAGDDLPNASTPIIVGCTAGDAATNIYTIAWSCGDGTGGGSTGFGSVVPDRYSTNIYLTVSH